MKNFKGAIKVTEDTADNYQQAGRALTREAARTMSGACACCETKEGTLYLWHLSVQTGDTISTTICHACSKETTIYSLLEKTLKSLLTAEEMKRNTLN